MNGPMIQVIDYPLIPEEVNLPSPDGAGAVPRLSVVVLLAGLVAAVMMI
jgi:hypothetical protein